MLPAALDPWKVVKNKIPHHDKSSCLFNESDGDQDPLPEEDEEAHGDQEDDAGDASEGQPGLSQPQQVVAILWGEVHLTLTYELHSILLNDLT